jgi:eukaryotic-like serine/threonine-protein kinase
VTLAPGTRVGSYEIGALVGAGGMGEVYKARDTRLDRTVAIKILPSALAADPEFRERFNREARAIAALTHPNVVTIHSVEEDAGHLYLTMEFVDGTPLTDAIPRDGLSLDKLLAIAISLADAVAAAHQAGITHRDLKPANVMLTAEGRVKVLDFGLAHLREEATVQSAATTAQLTGEGRILGTAAYMSPEQAEGRALDSRSDLFSLGIVLYEMATGERPFTGDTNMSILSAILKDPPKPISSIRPDVPRELARIIKRALQKDPEQRYQTAKDLRNDLQLLKAESDSGELTHSTVPAARSRRRSVPLGLAVGGTAVVAVTVSAALWWIFARPTSRQIPQTPWTAVTDYADSATQPALSPDGRMLAFIRGSGTFVSGGDIYIKLLPNGSPVQLTHDSLRKMDPRFSPDGTEVAFTSLDPNFNWNTYVVPVFGGREPRLLLSNAESLSWIGDHQYLFSEITTGFHMPVVTAGDARADQRLLYDPPTQGGMAHRSALSPDRQHILISEEMDITSILPCRVIPADGRDRGVIVGPPNSRCYNGAWTPDGTTVLLALNAGSGTHLWRQSFPNGQPEQITFGPSEEVGIAIDPSGTSLITSAGAGHDTVWVHDSGGDRLAISEGSPGNLQFSRDGTRLFFVDINASRRAEAVPMTEGTLRVYDVQQRRVDTLLGGRPIMEYDVSPDGKLLLYAMAEKGEPHVWLAPVDGTSPPRRVVPEPAQFAHFGPDGYVYYARIEAGTFAPWRVRLDGTHEEPAGDFKGAIGAQSPDGRWRVEWRLQTGTSQDHLYLQGAAAKPIDVPCRLCDMFWLDDHHFVMRSQAQSMGGTARTYIFPVSPENPVPDGIERMADLDRFAADRGARVIQHSAYLPSTGDTYAYLQYVAQRNLYRIPLR